MVKQNKDEEDEQQKQSMIMSDSVCKSNPNSSSIFFSDSSRPGTSQQDANKAASSNESGDKFTNSGQGSGGSGSSNVRRRKGIRKPKTVKIIGKTAKVTPDQLGYEKVYVSNSTTGRPN